MAVKKKEISSKVQPAAANIGAIDTEPKSTVKKSESKNIKGLVDGFATLPFDILGKENERWKLETAEASRLREALNGYLESKNIEKLNDPGVYLAVVVFLIMIPRITLEIKDAIERKKTLTAVQKRPAEPNRTDTGEKGQRQNDAAYEGLPAPGQQIPASGI